MRHAILFSGTPHRRYLNGLEFCYRTLLDRFKFDRVNIHVLIHDGTLPAAGGPGPIWPGDGTAYRICATGQGSRRAFVEVLDTLKHSLGRDDLLFINVAGHGGNYGDGRGPYLTVHPFRDHYTLQDFCADLAALPSHGSLLVLMSQCFSGGFNRPVIDASRARRTFIASAAAETECSHAVPNDRNWDSFQRNWIAALSGHDVNGSPLSRKLAGPDCRITVRQAFDYANDPDVRNPLDTPECAASSDLACAITLHAGCSPECHEGDRQSG